MVNETSLGKSRIGGIRVRSLSTSKPNFLRNSLTLAGGRVTVTSGKSSNGISEADTSISNIGLFFLTDCGPFDRLTGLT